MKTLGVLLFCFMLIMSVCLGPDTLAQDQRVSSPVNQLSTVTEIVHSLDKTSFSKARIGLHFEGGESYADGSDSMQSMNLSLSRLSEDFIFSPGFTVASINRCRLTLKNDQVKILQWGTSSYDRHLMSFAKFLLEGKKGEKKLTPQTGVLYIPLNELDHKGGKAPHLFPKKRDPKSPEMWRTQFKWKGFFRRSVFEMEITAAEGKDLTSSMTAQKLTFAFEDKKESEDFNIAFRRAIQLCSK